ncbi:hypothetical protein [Jannaschia ovalis]|uniref:Uncharacterized protein n=1 Tax=Jannaschia ovalis TaxID=3038773 RepID=A0ABY8LEU2_9RHOB|nr:hypothetical protein [Jannaschia sp. GRR-S6-38]WGH78590.1 hypothetical protein P8627_16490 [Jannaschia sp. GRR-S6-38]
METEAMLRAIPEVMRKARRDRAHFALALAGLESLGIWRGGPSCADGPNQSFEPTVDAARSVTKAAIYRCRSILQGLNVACADEVDGRCTDGSFRQRTETVVIAGDSNG